MTFAKTAVGVVAGKDAKRAYGKWEDRADRYWHKSSSAMLSLLIAQLLGWPLWQQLTAVAIGLTFGGGMLSPDVDQFAWFKALTPHLFPRKTLARLSGHGDPLSHHRLTHNPFGPAALELALFVIGLVLHWPMTLLLLGMLVVQQWVHHDLGDLLIGKGGSDAAIERSLKGGSYATGVMIPRGIPLVWWWRHSGLGWFKSGGFTCRLLTVACWVLIGWRLYVSVRGI